MRRFDIAWRPSLFELAFGPRTFDCDVSALDVAGLLQTIAERGHIKCIAAGRRAVKEPDHWHRRLLPRRFEWPRRRAPRSVMNLRLLARNSIRKRFGINDSPVSSTPVRSAPMATHSITLSARNTSSVGSSWPIALAVVRLITRLN